MRVFSENWRRELREALAYGMFAAGFAAAMTLLGNAMMSGPTPEHLSERTLQGRDRAVEDVSAIETADVAGSPTDAEIAEQARGPYQSMTLPQAVATNWNAPAVPWRSYERGMAEMRRTGKPGLLVVKTEWCQELCDAYQQAFLDTRVSDYADDFVFILADADTDPDAQRTYAIDGGYVPRTLLLTPTGALAVAQTGANDSHRFFVDPTSADPLIDLFERQLARDASRRRATATTPRDRGDGGFGIDLDLE